MLWGQECSLLHRQGYNLQRNTPKYNVLLLNFRLVLFFSRKRSTEQLQKCWKVTSISVQLHGRFMYWVLVDLQVTLEDRWWLETRHPSLLESHSLGSVIVITHKCTHMCQSLLIGSKYCPGCWPQHWIVVEVAFLRIFHEVIEEAPPLEKGPSSPVPSPDAVPAPIPEVRSHLRAIYHAPGNRIWDSLGNLKDIHQWHIAWNFMLWSKYYVAVL